MAAPPILDAPIGLWQFAWSLIGEWRRTAALGLFFLCFLPFIVIGVLYSESRGIIVTPTLKAMFSRGEEHIEQTSLIRRIALNNERSLDALAQHNRESTRKDEIIAYLLLEDCEIREKQGSSRCKRLKKFLKGFDDGNNH